MKKTPLYDWHKSRGALMGDFGGYAMPMWYPDGMRVEHLSVLTHVGLFDTSHMSAIMFRGKGAYDFLQYTLSKDLTRVGKNNTPLGHCRCTNGAFLDERGWVVDDCVVFYIDPECYMAAINAGMGRIVYDHLTAHINGFSDVELELIDDDMGKIDIQGPHSARVLYECIRDPERVFSGMGFYHFKGRFDKEPPPCDDVKFDCGADVLLSRSGYTGEFGFEIFVHADDTAAVWDSICRAGERYGMRCCGLAARDSLRAGAVLPLSHQDVGDWPFINNPWTYALPYNDDHTSFTKDFVGRRVIEHAEHAPHTLPFAGFDPRKVDTHGAPPEVFTADGKRIGTVLTCATDVGIGRVDGGIVRVGSPDAPEGFVPRGLSCGFVLVDDPLEAGTPIVLRDARREIRVEIARSVRPGKTSRRKLSAMLEPDAVTRGCCR